MSGKNNTPAEMLGREIRRRRHAAGYTLDVLAKRAGLTPNYLGMVELGRRDPSLSTLKAIASGLNIAVGELFGGVSGLSEIGMEAGLLYDQVDPDVQAAMLSILREARRHFGGG